MCKRIYRGREGGKERGGSEGRGGGRGRRRGRREGGREVEKRGIRERRPEFWGGEVRGAGAWADRWRLLISPSGVWLQPLSEPRCCLASVGAPVGSPQWHSRAS